MAMCPLDETQTRRRQRVDQAQVELGERLGRQIEPADHQAEPGGFRLRNGRPDE